MNRSIVALLMLMAPASAFAQNPFELKDGDRVVLIGGTLIERDQARGDLETRLTRLYPDRSVTFRNLGWSGDTVEGPSRAGFGSTADGFKQLKDHVLALKPTVIIVGYGGVEAFDGAAGLPGFAKNLETLLAAIEPTKARLVFLAPNAQENLGPPLPDPTRHNADIALYSRVIREAAQKRNAAFFDLAALLPDGAKATPRRPLTDNGIHLNPYGYYRMAAAFEQKLAPAPGRWFIQIDTRDVRPFNLPPLVATGEVPADGFEKIPGGYRVKIKGQILPAPSPPDGGPETEEDHRSISAIDLAAGRYTLKIDGKPIVTADAKTWETGIKLTKGPDFDQAEALQKTIVAKNELYFYRWRPQNETYLFGFRKHEQGQNAREIPLFDPLVAEKEAEIARLRVPVFHTYELTREGEVAR